MFLKLSRLVVRRTVGAEICRAGAVLINGIPAKAGREVKIGDTLTLKKRGQKLHVRIATLPTGNVSKAIALTLYEILSSTPYNELDELLTVDADSLGGSSDKDED
ncbi:MAG: ribosome-associated heat shock protein [bacterium]|nr:MAG: ribosome-associated heat shock protein [bacterium]